MVAILLIDDEPRVGAALRFALEPKGYSVAQELSGTAGEARALAERFDCILLDVDLAGEDGLAVCRRLRAASAMAGVPVLLLSGLVDPASAARGLAAGANDYLRKPFTPRELVARIEAHRRGMADV